MTADLLKQSKKLQSLYHKSVGKPRPFQEYIKYIKFRANYNSTKRRSTIILKHYYLNTKLIFGKLGEFLTS